MIPKIVYLIVATNEHNKKYIAYNGTKISFIYSHGFKKYYNKRALYYESKEEAKDIIHRFRRSWMLSGRVSLKKLLIV